MKKKLVTFLLLVLLVMPITVKADEVQEQEENPQTGTKENLMLAGAVIVIGATVFVLKRNKNVISKI